MRYLVFMLLLVALGCADKKKYHDTVKENAIDTTTALGVILKFQSDLNQSFRDPETSPLPDRYRKHFEGLDFFAPDTSYRITAKLVRTPEAVPFMMPTTTARKARERVYGIAQFTLGGNTYELELYQSPDAVSEPGEEDYLFLPFLDATNGQETYAGGRYIDLEIPDGDHIVIDFNSAYNPYCVYNKKYSCPIVPAVNRLPLKVKAGVKMFIPN